ncbi:MAG: hypothetical protein HY864_18510 [Chloroflexi bacterium]|nr:hypothetical protein [Chloroflexota bacterium]
MKNPFEPSNRKFLNLLILLTLLLACGLPGTNLAPTPSIQFSNHIIVSLTEPADGESFPISAGLSVRGEAISDGSIARMELWVDGNLYEEYTAPEDGLGLLVHYWDWSPNTLGTHTLMVRAYDNQNQTAFSNVLHIKGVEDPGFVVLAKAQDGDTLASLAEKYNVSVDDVIRENPQLAESASFSDGAEVFVPIGAPAVAVTPSTRARLLMNLSQLAANRGLSPQAAPGAPELTVTGQGCSASLSISDLSDNELGFNIYRLDPGAMSFFKLTSLPAHEGDGSLSYQDSNLYGLYGYYAAAFDADSEAAGNLVSVNIVDSNCAGEPLTIDELAAIPAGVEDYYLYVSVNNGNWRRFPANDFTYLKKSESLDFTQVASSLAPNFVGDISMQGEVWGVVNGGAALLGTFEKSFKANQPPSSFEPSVPYLFLASKLEVRGVYDPSADKYPWLVEKGTAYGMETFRFGTDTGAAYGIWQVASVPFASEASFNPACLLLTGKTSGSGTTDSPLQFGIDFSALKPKVESVVLSPFENMLNQTPAFVSPFSPEKLDTSAGQVVTKPSWSSGAFGLGESPVPANFDPCGQNLSAEGVVTYFVRILPVTNGAPAGTPSNTVKITYDPNGEIKVTFTSVPVPTVTYYDVNILDFTGVHVPEWQYQYCVVVVENNAPQGSPWQLYPPGTVLCPEKDQGGNGDFLDNLSNAIEDAFNFISGLYNKLSDWVTELVDKLNPLCIQAKLVSKAVDFGQNEVKDACHFIAAAVVTAAKTYAGLPPSLPDFDKLTKMGKDNLVDLAAQQLEDSGIPCPDDCKDVIRKGIDYSLEQVKQSMSNSSCSSEVEESGYKKLCLPSYVITEPDPRGQPAPAVLQVRVIRRLGTTGQGFPEPKSCNVLVNVTAKNDSHTGQQYVSEAGFKWNGASIDGKLFSSAGAFPIMQPGESTVIPIILDPYPFWLAGHKEFVKKGSKPEHFDDWYLLYQGALADITAGGSCKFEFPEGTGFSENAVNGDSQQVGPLGEAWKTTCHPYNCP